MAEASKKLQAAKQIHKESMQLTQKNLYKIPEFNIERDPREFALADNAFDHTRLEVNAASLSAQMTTPPELLNRTRKQLEAEPRDRLKNVLSALQQTPDLWKQDPLLAHQIVLDTVLALPLNKADWQDINSTEAKEILKQSGELAEYYFASLTSPQQKIVQPERMFIFKKLIYIQNHLLEIAFNQPHYELFHLEYTHRLFHQGFKAYTPTSSLLFQQLLEMDHPRNQFRPSSQSTNDTSTGFISLNAPRCAIVSHRSSPILLLSRLRESYSNYYQTIKNRFPEASEALLAFYAVRDPHLPAELRAPINTILYSLTSATCSSFSGSIRAIAKPSDIKSSWHMDRPLENKAEYIDFEVGFDGFERLVDVKARDEECWQKLKDPLMACLKFIPYHETNLCAENRPSQVKAKYSNAEYHLFTRMFLTKHLGLNDLLGYCREYPGMIQHAEFQQVFLRLLIKNAPIKPKDAPQGLHQLVNLEVWLQSEFQRSLASGQDSAFTSLFLLRAMRYCRQLAPLEINEPLRKKIPFKEYFKELLHQTKDSEGHGLVYGELLAHFSQNPSLNSDEMQLFIEALLFVKEYSLGTHPIDALWRFEIEKSYALKMDEILTFIQQNPSRINDIICSSHPDYPRHSSWTQDSNNRGQFTNNLNGDTYFPAKGQLIQLNAYGNLRFIPSIIRKNIVFQQLFPILPGENS